MLENVVDVEGLSRRFGSTLALDDVHLQMRSGLVYGLVGANGHGKTTLIKHLLGLLRAKQGSVRVFGLDPVKSPVEVLQRIGYLSEERDLPAWMRINELLRYTAAYYPNWSNDYATELMETFCLDGTRKIKDLSKGMRAQSGLIAAVAHRPDLLVLDEPSTGLDAVVRKDILNAIIRAVADDGRTAIFSSHLLDEVELMSDYVFMIDRGKLVLEGELDAIKEQHHLVHVQHSGQQDVSPQFDGMLSCEKRGNGWIVVCHAVPDQVKHSVRSVGGEVISIRNASLQEIFVAKVDRQKTLVAGC